jgi:hypothetical protein
MDKSLFGLVAKLLEQWRTVLRINAKNSMVKAARAKGGLKKRVKFEGKLVIFDYPTTKVQHSIQQELLKLMPELQSLILSEPSVLDFDWITEDYLELYNSHYNLVIDKLSEYVERVKC